MFVFKQKTAYEMRISDWSSDVCSSDLVERLLPQRRRSRDIGIVEIETQMARAHLVQRRRKLATQGIGKCRRVLPRIAPQQIDDLFHEPCMPLADTYFWRRRPAWQLRHERAAGGVESGDGPGRGIVRTHDTPGHRPHAALPGKT